MLPQASAGRELECGHHQREVPRDDLRAHADRLAQREGVEPAAGRPRHRHRDGAALDLGGPTGVVAEDLGGPGDVDGLGDHHRLAVVEGLQLRELARPGRGCPRRYATAPAAAAPGSATRHGPLSNARRAAGPRVRRRSTPLCGTVVSTASVAGSTVSNRRPESASTHCPSMYICLGRDTKSTVLGSRSVLTQSCHVGRNYAPMWCTSPLISNGYLDPCSFSFEMAVRSRSGRSGNRS